MFIIGLIIGIFIGYKLAKSYHVTVTKRPEGP